MRRHFSGDLGFKRKNQIKCAWDSIAGVVTSKPSSVVHGMPLSKQAPYSLTAFSHLCVPIQDCKIWDLNLYSCIKVCSATSKLHTLPLVLQSLSRAVYPTKSWNQHQQNADNKPLGLLMFCNYRLMVNTHKLILKRQPWQCRRCCASCTQNMGWSKRQLFIIIAIHEDLLQ